MYKDSDPDQIRFTFENIIINKKLSNRNSKTFKPMRLQMKRFVKFTLKISLKKIFNSNFKSFFRFYVEDAMQIVIDTRKSFKMADDKVVAPELKISITDRMRVMLYCAFIELSDKELAYDLSSPE